MQYISYQLKSNVLDQAPTLMQEASEFDLLEHKIKSKIKKMEEKLKQTNEGSEELVMPTMITLLNSHKRMLICLQQAHAMAA